MNYKIKYKYIFKVIKYKFDVVNKSKRYIGTNYFYKIVISYQKIIC